MLIRLSELKPNPKRDFAVDPLDQAAIEALTVSISEDGFWGGVTARPSASGGYEIAAGHHRIEAARRAGLTEVEIFVGDFDDEAMVRIYARENATQRTNQVTAIDGAVLAAVRYLTRVLLGGTYDGTTTDGLFESKKAFDVARGTLLKGDGIGRKLILRVFGDTPGMTENRIKDSLFRLKASGDYARNIRAIASDIESEVAVKAVNAVANQKITFDLAEVVPYLPNTHQISTFQKLTETFDQYVPLESQAPLAKALRDEAAEQGKELSANFIHQNFLVLLTQAKKVERAMKSKEECERLELASFQEQFEAIQVEAARQVRKLITSLGTLNALRRKAPKGLPLPYLPTLRRASSDVAESLYKLNKEYSL